MVKSFVISRNTKVAYHVGTISSKKYASDIFARDFKKVFSSRLNTVYEIEDADIVFYCDNTIVEGQKKQLKEEQFRIDFQEANQKIRMHITVIDSLGLMNAVIYLSNTYFEIAPFYFWLSQPIKKQTYIKIPVVSYQSSEKMVKYRGWFINDEDCFIGWTDVYPPPRKVWLHAFEALIRCGGNMVLAGTDLPKDGEAHELASELGLYVTQHHCAPMDGEMFLRAYPDLEPSFDLYKEAFCRLWEEGVIANKKNKVVWVLGFRGQGDIPFWHNDSKYDTDESRGALISSIIEKQYAILKKHVDAPTCCVYLYQETMALYNSGYLKFRDGFIKIWSDNGYGAMITRRHAQWDPRIVSLPNKENGVHRDGVYYHVAFHDLEASNHLTMMAIEPNLMIDELKKVKENSQLDFILINTANIKQHTVALSFLSQYWNNEIGSNTMSWKVKDYCEIYYPKHANQAEHLINDYLNCPVRYGPYEDNVIGDEYYHHPIRKLIKEWFNGNMGGDCLLIAPYLNNETLLTQVYQYKSIIKDSRAYWANIVSRIDYFDSYSMEADLTERLNEDNIALRDNVIFPIAFHYYSAKSAYKVCKAYEHYTEAAIMEAFLDLTDAINTLKKLKGWYKLVQHDEWKNFYKADWLTNVDATIYALKAVRSHMRIIGDGPDLFHWYKCNIMPPEERKIYLENTQRQVFEDDALAEMLKEIKE